MAAFQLVACFRNNNQLCFSLTFPTQEKYSHSAELFTVELLVVYLFPDSEIVLVSFLKSPCPLSIFLSIFSSKHRHSWFPQFNLRYHYYQALTQVSFCMICRILLAGSKKSMRQRSPSPRYCLSTTLNSCQRTVTAVALKGRYRADKVLWIQLSKDSAS